MKRIITVCLALGVIVSGSVWAVNSFAAKSTHHSRHKVEHRHQLNNQSTNVDINKASAASFASVKGIGPKKAQAIIEYRKQHGKFGTLDDLAKIKGIGKKTVQRILRENPGRLTVS